MSDRGHQLLYRAAHAAARRAGAVPDADLVRQLATTYDRAAFELLLWRHGPAVWGVCRRVLGPGPDAEDAFQAAFLALSRRAGTITDGNAVAGWLHRVAVRTAVATAKDRARRTAREAPTPILPEAVAPEDPVQIAAGRELGAVLDAAISRLPDQYRRVFLLCEVYGRDPAEAAAELNCPVGTIASRRSRARRRLRAALARRGLAVPATLAVAVLPPGLVDAAIRTTVAPMAASRLIALADRAARPVVLPWKFMAAAVLVAASAGVLARAQLKNPSADRPPPAAAKKANVEVGPIRDKPLPDGAVARIGSTRLRHAGSVYDVAFSPDGKWIASASADGVVIVWDAAAGERRFQFRAVRDVQPQIAFMDGGKALWIHSPISPEADSAGSELRRFSMADGKELPAILTDAERKTLVGFAFDPAGKRFGYVPESGATATFRVFDAETQKPIANFSVHVQWPVRPVFAPGGKVVAFPPGHGRAPGSPMPVIDTDTAKEIVTITDPEYFVDTTAFAPDGRTLASICTKPKEGKYTVAVWDATTGKLVRRITGVEMTASCLAFSPDGKSLAVGNTQRQAVQLFDVATGKEVRRFRSSPSVMRVAFSPDGKHLAAARTTGTVSVWDVETGRPTAASADPDTPVGELRFVDRDRLLVKTDRAAVYDWRAGKVLEQSAELRDLAFDYKFISPDRRLLAAPDGPGPIRLHDAATGAAVKRLEGHTVLAEPIVFSPDGKRLYSRGHDQTVRGWDIGTGKELFKADFGGASSGDHLAVSPDGQWLAGSTREGDRPIVQMWGAATGKAGFQFKPPPRRVTRLAFSPDSGLLAAAGGEGWGRGPEPGWLVVWDLQTGTVRRTIREPNGMLFGLAFTPDGRSLVTGGMDGVVRMWEVASGQQRRALPGHQSVPHTMAVAPDGRHLATTSSDQPTSVWDLYAAGGGPPTEAGAKQLLTDLGGEPAVAFAAICRLAAHSAEAVPLLQVNLKPAAATDPKRLQELIRDLDADRFAVRERAAADLLKLGDEAEPALRTALASTSSAEARERLTALLPKVGVPTADRLRELRAVEVLEIAGTPEAAALLGEWDKDTTLRIRPDAAAGLKRLSQR